MNITDKEFEMISEFVRSRFGINLHEGKRNLVISRLGNTIRELNLTSFTEYFQYLADASDDGPVVEMLNRLTTNHTYFYREEKHFEFLRSVVLPELAPVSSSQQVRIWSAGCSIGAEPYSISMVLADYYGTRFEGKDVKVLATDISTKALTSAKAGLYQDGAVERMPEKWRKQYFTDRGQGFIVKTRLKEKVVFKRLNLLSKFPFKDQFDVIFCRNVMIYFEEDVKRELVRQFYKALKPGGYLFIGHSEVIDKKSVDFKYVRPAVYKKG